MQRDIFCIALSSALICAAPSWASDIAAPSAAGNREKIAQLVDCVKRRTADRTVLYSEAIKLCKEQLKEQASSDALLAAGAATTP
jgi:hypothetical protein